MLKLERPQPFCPESVEGHVKRLARGALRVRPYDRRQRPAAGVNVTFLAVLDLVSAEDREVLVIPEVSPLVVVLRGVAPQREAGQAGVKRPHVRVHRRGLEGKVVRAVRILVGLHVEGDADLADDRGHALGPDLSGKSGDVLNHLGQSSGDRSVAEDGHLQLQRPGAAAAAVQLLRQVDANPSAETLFFNTKPIGSMSRISLIGKGEKGTGGGNYEIVRLINHVCMHACVDW